MKNEYIKSAPTLKLMTHAVEKFLNAVPLMMAFLCYTIVSKQHACQCKLFNTMVTLILIRTGSVLNCGSACVTIEIWSKFSCSYFFIGNLNIYDSETKSPQISVSIGGVSSALDGCTESENSKINWIQNLFWSISYIC